MNVIFKHIARHGELVAVAQSNNVAAPTSIVSASNMPAWKVPGWTVYFSNGAELYLSDADNAPDAARQARDIINRRVGGTVAMRYQVVRAEHHTERGTRTWRWADTEE